MQVYGEGVRRDSGILAYEAGPGFIRVKFVDGGVYLYTDRSTGVRNVQVMTVLARHGSGLNTYINRYVRRAYERREH